MSLIACVSVIAWLVALMTWQRAKSMLNDLESSDLRKGNKMFFENELGGVERSISFLATLASALPLLGLLGTVVGMLTTFNVIQKYGTGQPALLSNGIRQALFTTQAGLLAALPVLFFHHMISSCFRKIDSELKLFFHESGPAGKTIVKEK
jgi:biopolymer transport protein ExbB/TolQ